MGSASSECGAEWAFVKHGVFSFGSSRSSYLSLGPAQREIRGFSRENCYALEDMQTDTPSAPKSLQEWLVEYAESHQNPVNILLHKVCVPLIFWSLLGMLAGLDHWVGRLVLGVVCVVGLVFYARLSLKIFALMVVVILLCERSYAALLQIGFPLFWVALLIFVIAWVGQFVGHSIEGRRPSFLQDLQFLLIGPLWVVYSFLPR